MAIRSAQADAIDKLIASSKQYIDDIREGDLHFDPWEVEGFRNLWADKSDPIEPLFLKGTRRRYGLDQIGSVTVALFDKTGPKVCNEDVRQHRAAIGIILKEPTEQDFAQIEARGANPSHVWIGTVALPNNPEAWAEGEPATLTQPITVVSGIIPGRRAHRPSIAA
jgi:hypothetical protein